MIKLKPLAKTMNRKVNNILPLIIIISTIMACNNHYEYRQILDTELSKNERNDSLFLGLKLGMTKKDFFTECWKMNKQGLIIQGPGNLSVQYEIDSGLKYPAYMRFYPKFHNDTIYEMPVQFIYRDWAPWNQSLSSDSLVADVENLMEQWYMGDFIELENEDKTKRVQISVQGNRRIRVFKHDISTVGVVISDMFTLPKVVSDEKM